MFLQDIQCCAVMKKVRCGGQPLIVDPGVDINLVHKSAYVVVSNYDWEVALLC